MAIKCPVCGCENEDDALVCDLCQLVLRKEGQPLKPDFGRRFEGFARFVAQEMVKEPLFSGLGIELDYSPASLWGVDAAIDLAIGTAGEAPEIDISDYNPGKEKFGTQVGLGSYYGEVCRRVLGGVWQQDPRWNKDLGPDAEFILARIVFTEGHIYPIGRAIRRYKNGANSYFFLQFLELANKLKVPAKPWGRGFVKQAGLILDRGTLTLEKRAAEIKQFCKMGAAYDPDVAGDILALTVKISRLASPAAPAPLPDQARLLAAQQILYGELAFNAGRLEEAIGFFKEALAHDPSDPRAWKDLAVILYKLERYSEQADCWGRLSELAPGDPAAWRQRGLACSRAGRFKEALDSFARCLELAPGNAEALLERAVVLDRSGEQGSALRQAEGLFADPALMADLKKRPFDYYARLVTAEMGPELKKLITEKLG